VAAAILAWRLGVKIPNDYLFIGEVGPNGIVYSHAAGSAKNFDVTFASLQKMYDAGVRTLVVSVDLLPVVEGILGDALDGLDVFSVAYVNGLLDFVFEPILAEE
jgi:hypothetical protein